MADFSMKGTGGVAYVTMPLDKTTIKVIGKDHDSAKGKAVALTGNNTVGYGSDGDTIRIIEAGIDPDKKENSPASSYGYDEEESELSDEEFYGRLNELLR